MKVSKSVILLTSLSLSLIPSLNAATLNVGPTQPFKTIQAAYARAAPGDTILVQALAQGESYKQEALQVRKPRIHFKSASSDQRVRIDASGFNYSGRGSTPRAVFQFNPEACQRFRDCGQRFIDDKVEFLFVDSP